jgi:hypothetical protein
LYRSLILTFHGIWSYRFEAEGRRQEAEGKTRKRKEKEEGGRRGKNEPMTFQKLFQDFKVKILTRPPALCLLPPASHQRF